MTTETTNGLSKIERLEAFDKIRLCSRIVLDGLDKTAAEDAYIFNGSMNDVEDLLEAVEVIEHDDRKKMVDIDEP